MRNFDEMQEIAERIGKKKVVIALAHDEVVLNAVEHCRKKGVIQPILIGDTRKMREIAASGDYDLAAAELIDETEGNRAAEIAVGLVRQGKADLIMKGKIQTADLIRAVLDRKMGIRTERLLSQVNIHYAPGMERFIFVSDAAINISPNLEQKAAICRNAIGVAHALGIPEPKVALLTAHEAVNAAMPATVEADALAMMNKRREISGAVLDGPIALDVALDTSAAVKKGIYSPIAGQADILIAPNIEAANILTKAITYFGQARNAGIIIGAGVPIILLSRADNSDTKINSICLGVLLASRQ